MATSHKASASAQANEASYGKLVYIIGYIILGIGAIYGDVMFITLLGGALPQGPLGIAAIIGAFLTSASLIALVLGKSFQFRPGDQITTAWVFTWIEIGVMSLNVILSALHGMHVDPSFLEYWLYLCPATPFVAVIGWILLIYADPRRHHLHEDMAMDDQLTDKKREHMHNVHVVRLDLQNQALEQQKVYMGQYMNSPEVQAALRHGSEQIALGIVADIIQRPIMPAAPAATPAPALPNARTIDDKPKRIDGPRTQAARPRKPLPRQRRFTPRLAKKVLTEEREVGVPSGPLAERETEKMPVPAPIHNRGSHIVNRSRKGAATFPTDD